MTPVQRYTELSVGESLELFERNAHHGVVDTGRYHCPYVVWGSGPPLVIIHGMADDYRSFILPMASLSECFTCIAYNQPTGRPGEGRVRGYRHHHLVEDLWILLDHLGVSQVSLLGSSFGSTIAMKAMHEDSQRVRKAIFQGGFAYRPLLKGEYWLSWFARYFPGTMRSLPLRREAMLKIHHEAFDGVDPAVWRFFLKQSGKPLIRAVARWALMLHRTDVRKLASAVRQPVLLICGDRDPLVPHSCQEYLFKHLPNSSMFIINGCGHFPMFTHVRAFTETVRQFMNMTECAAGSREAPFRVKACG